MTEDKKALIEYRLSQARDSIKEADVLLREGMSCRSVMNRLYYAMFYGVLALLQNRQIGTSKHSGAVSLFDMEFIKTGMFNKEYQKPCIAHLSFARKVIIWNSQRLLSRI